MVSITALWLPILVSAALTWIVAAVVWMVLPHHKSDYARLPSEASVRDALKNVAPGQYNIPHCASMEDMKAPETKRKFDEGPVGFITILPNGTPAMGKNMLLSFGFYLVVGVVIAYLASRTLTQEVEYLAIFQLTGTVAWAAYGFSAVQEAIWFGRPWTSVIKNLFDAFLYALVTAGSFAALWP